VSGQYERRDETCPHSTGGRGELNLAHRAVHAALARHELRVRALLHHDSTVTRRVRLVRSEGRGVSD